VDGFGPATEAWFRAAFSAPTEVQARGWPVIAGGGHTLLIAPTGSGKTLAAFLVGIDRVVRARLAGEAPRGVSVLYVSPLKALVVDVERNLRAPLAGVLREAPGVPPVRVDVRTGDTPARDRRRFLRDPGDILVTTPESLYLLLGGASREALRHVHTVIVDEVHALVPTKRGVHLTLSLERLDALAGRTIQRVGLSATARPVEPVARFLGGVDREVVVVDTSRAPRLDLRVEVPVDDMDRPVVEVDGVRTVEGSIWPALHPRILELVRAHRTTLVFVNSRLLAERLCAKLNEAAGEDVAQTHHGSLSHARRAEVEDALKSGRLACLVATSSLELGIDMGSIDLVIQVSSPGAVARGLQRVGRAGHQVGGLPKGRFLPKHKGDVLESAVVAERMLAGDLEPLSSPRNCLDVLAQQIVAMVSVEPWTVAELERVVRRAWPYRELPRDALMGTLDMLEGRYPSTAHAELHPRIVWDRETDVLGPRKGSAVLAALNGGTIPDRGLFGVFSDAGKRIGELDEEMVYETREGDRLVLGASTWRVDQITQDRVVVVPAPGEPGRLPFWRGDGPGRPIELGRAIGAFVRELLTVPPEDRPAWVAHRAPLDPVAVGNLLAHVDAQIEATGTIPTDRAITVECFRDEIGDWRVCVLTPYGARVHAPWALAMQRRLSQETGFEVHCLASDDGIAVRFAEIESLPVLDLLFLDPDEVDALVTDEVRHAPSFAAKFRENAARALLMPKHRPGKRTPLWAQRRRAEALLATVEAFPSFPIVLETYRECLHDQYDLDGLRALMAGVRDRTVRVDRVETRHASPFARGLVFAWVAGYLYEVDTPLAERKAQALTLDRALLRELLGQDALRDLLDPDAVAEVEAWLACTVEERHARDADGLHDLLRRLGDLTEAEVAARADGDAPAWLDALSRTRRAVSVRVGGEERWIATDDVARYRDGLGVVPPGGLPAVYLEATPNPLEALFLRYARVHGPFVEDAPAARWGLPVAVARVVLDGLVHSGQLEHGEIRPGGTRREYCHPDVLRRLRRVSLARARGRVAPVDGAVYSRFLLEWHGVGSRRAGPDRLREVLLLLEGRALPWSAWCDAVLPARVAGFAPDALDLLGASGEIVWCGCGALGADDGWVAMARRSNSEALPPPADLPTGPIHDALVAHLRLRGASFSFELMSLFPGVPTAEITGALWDLVFAGWLTNDTFHGLRGLRGARTVGQGGRWGLRSLPGPVDTNRWLQRANTLLDRYGVLVREVAAAESVPGGFSDLYRVLRVMEEGGHVRRGLFVDGWGGAQFARPGVVDRLRAVREESQDAVVLAATDPALAWGALLPWPETSGDGRPRRVAHAVVVLVGGLPVLFAERGARTVCTFAGEDRLEVAARALGGARALLGARMPRIDKINGEVAREAPEAAAFVRAGWVPEHRGLGWVG
jgi:ATP-dependent Lhr-like helicase